MIGCVCPTLVNSALRSLDILGNNIGEEQANNLIQLLDASDTLTTLCGFTGTEIELDLSGRNLSPSCAILVANEVKVNSPMVKFTLSGKYQIAMEEWTDGPPVTLEIDMTEVDISNKHLGVSGAIMAAAFLPKMT